MANESSCATAQCDSLLANDMPHSWNNDFPEMQYGDAVEKINYFLSLWGWTMTATIVATNKKTMTATAKMVTNRALIDRPISQE